MNAKTGMPKALSIRCVSLPLLLLGFVFCFGNAKRTWSQDVPGRVAGGITTASARQPESPAFMREVTMGIESDADKCVRSCVALDRMVLRNKSELPITGYRLGWVIIFADAKKPAEVHVANPVALYKAIGAQQEREFSENLVPPVPTSPEMRMISYFVAEIEQESRVFTEDRNKIASDQYEQFWHPAKRQ